MRGYGRVSLIVRNAASEALVMIWRIPVFPIIELPSAPFCIIYLSFSLIRFESDYN